MALGKRNGREAFIYLTADSRLEALISFYLLKNQLLANRLIGDW